MLSTVFSYCFWYRLTIFQNCYTFASTYTLCPQKKHPQHFQLYHENQLANFNNFWHKYS